MPPSPEVVLPKGAAYRFDDGALRLSLDLDVYALAAVRRSCYWLTDHSYVFLAKTAPNTLEVWLVAKPGRSKNTDELAWTFLNDLIDQQLRIDIGGETAAIRELIVAQAFADVDVIDHRGRSAGSTEASDEPPVHTWRPVS